MQALMPYDLREALEELEEIESWFDVVDWEEKAGNAMWARLEAQRRLVSALIAKYKSASAVAALGKVKNPHLVRSKHGKRA
jgi:hypothetical protein